MFARRSTGIRRMRRTLPVESSAVHSQEARAIGEHGWCRWQRWQERRDVEGVGKTALKGTGSVKSVGNATSRGARA